LHELPLALTDVFLVSFQEILRNKKRSRATRGILCHLGSSRSHQALRLRPGNTRTRTAFFTATSIRFTASSTRFTATSTRFTASSTRFTATSTRFTASNGSSRLGLQQRRRQICRLTTSATPKVCRVPGGSNTPTILVISWR
jgi:hypothetical protein